MKAVPIQPTHPGMPGQRALDVPGQDASLLQPDEHATICYGYLPIVYWGVNIKLSRTTYKNY